MLAKKVMDYVRSVVKELVSDLRKDGSRNEKGGGGILKVRGLAD